MHCRWHGHANAPLRARLQRRRARLRSARVQAYLQTDSVAAALSDNQCVLSAINILKKICDHPALLTDRAASLALNAGKRGPRAPRGGGSGSEDSSDSDASAYDSLDDFIASDSDGSASSEGEDVSEGEAAPKRAAASGNDVEDQVPFFFVFCWFTPGLRGEPRACKQRECHSRSIRCVARCAVQGLRACRCASSAQRWARTSRAWTRASCWSACAASP